MTTGSLALPRGGISGKTYANVAAFLSLLALALLTRAASIGDPAIDIDEEFYLLVGDRLWHGALPYVDIWDRKPILLFLIYAALRPLSPDGIVAYQAGAVVFAALTAFVIVRIARRFASTRGAFLAGLAYLLYLPVLGGEGGQSPVFYNLFMALGALEVLRAGEATSITGLWRHGACAMIWAGLAIQVKYIAVIEGISFGLWLVVLSLRRGDRSFGRVLIPAAGWILIALAPTLLATGFFLLIGHGREFIEANFLSIFEKHGLDGSRSAYSLQLTAIKLAPLLLLTFLSGLLLWRRRPASEALFFLMLWTGFAIIGFFAIGNYYDHYALPLLVPTVTICSALLATPIGAIAGMALFGWVFVTGCGLQAWAQRQSDQSRTAALVTAAQPYAAQGCIYVNDGPPILYLLTHSCLPTRYAFPSHLNDAEEAGATDATHNMRDLLAARPAAIFVASKPTLHPRNAVTAAMLDAALEANYQRIAVLPDLYPWREQILYARKDLLPPTP